MESERIKVTRDGGVAHVELAREGKFNAMDKAMFEAIGETFRSLGPDPSVRAILLSGRGRHFTAGLDLPTACDIRLASADAFFQVAEVDVAITADLGTLQRLTHLIPEGLVRELAYTGRRMEAEEAARLGLVNRVLADRDSLVAAGLEL